MEEYLLTYYDLSLKLKELNIPQAAPIMVHASLTSLGEIHGGAETLLGALFCLSDQIIFPAFTYKTMIIPDTGPENNAIEYGQGKDNNAMVEMYQDDLPVDHTLGVLAEVFRKMPDTRRSNHPILSFCGVNVDEIIESQSIQKPLKPLHVFCDQGGWILLIGTDHTVNTSIHYGEQQAGRYGFIRWALTDTGVVECPGFPGCSDGFEKIVPFIQGITHSIKIGKAFIQTLSAGFLTDIVRAVLESDPTALLCDRTECLRCDTVRTLYKQKKQAHTYDN